MTNGATTTLASSLQVSGINNIEFTEEGEESITASNVSYSNTTSGMTSGNVQNAIDELFQSVSGGAGSGGSTFFVNVSTGDGTYTIEIDETVVTKWVPLELSMYPNITVSTTGELSCTGAAETVSLSTAPSHVGWYTQDGSFFYRFEGVKQSQSEEAYAGNFRRVCVVAHPTADKTVAEIYAAFQSGAMVFALRDGCVLPLVEISETEAVFSVVTQNKTAFLSITAAEISYRENSEYGAATSASAVAFDGSAAGLGSTNVQAAMDELMWLLGMY